LLVVKQIVQILHATFQPNGGDNPDENDGYPNGDTYDDPEPRDTFGWYPLTSQINSDADYDRRVIDKRVVMVPDATVYTVRDQITFPGDDIWFVSEDLRDYTTGPFPYRPGGEIVVEKITG
jgi:hypothetical protein